MASTAWSMLMLLLVLASIPVALWSLKRLQQLRPGGAPRPLEVTAQLALGARERVVLVRLNERLLVLGVTPQQVTLLTETDASQLPRDAAAPGSTFRSVLARASAGFTGRPS